MQIKVANEPLPTEITEPSLADEDAVVVMKIAAKGEFRPVDVTDDGETEQVDIAGCPEQLIATV